MNKHITKKELEHAKNVQRIFKELGIDCPIESFLGPQSKADEIVMHETVEKITSEDKFDESVTGTSVGKI